MSPKSKKETISIIVNFIILFVLATVCYEVYRYFHEDRLCREAKGIYVGGRCLLGVKEKKL